MDTTWITNWWNFDPQKKIGTIIRGNKNMLIHMNSSELESYKKVFEEKNIQFKNNIEDFDNDIACWTYEVYHHEIHCDPPPSNCFSGYKFIVNKPALEILNP